MKILENNFKPTSHGWTASCPKCGSKVFFQESDYKMALNEVVSPGKEPAKFLQCPCCGSTMSLNEWLCVTPTDAKLYD